MQEVNESTSEEGAALWQVIAASERLRARVEQLLESAGYPVVREGVLPRGAQPNTVRAAVELSGNQRVVLAAWLECDTQEQVAERLHMSVDTVKGHARAIFKALGVHSRHRAVVDAIRLGIIEVRPPEQP